MGVITMFNSFPKLQLNKLQMKKYSSTEQAFYSYFCFIFSLQPMLTMITQMS